MCGVLTCKIKIQKKMKINQKLFTASGCKALFISTESAVVQLLTLFIETLMTHRHQIDIYVFTNNVSHTMEWMQVI